MNPVIHVILILQLFLPNQPPSFQKFEMDDITSCLVQAEAFLTGFALSRNGEGGDAIAVCHVKKEEGLPT